MNAEQLELNLWQAIAMASGAPEQADLLQIWDVLALALEFSSDLHQQLQMAGVAIERIADLYVNRADLVFEELRVPDGDPVLSSRAFDCYVRQSVVDFDQFLEPLIRSPRKSPRAPASSVVAVVDKTVLMEAMEDLLDPAPNPEAIAVAHDENIADWVAKIAAYVRDRGSAIRLTDLQVGLGMPMVELWLGLLLGGFGLEQRGEFYEGKELFILFNGIEGILGSDLIAAFGVASEALG
jgi:hypothetical protein